MCISSRMNNIPSGSKSVVGEILTRPSMASPSILKRKRKLPMNEDSQSIPMTKSLGEVIEWSNLEYVRDLASRYTPSSLMLSRSCPTETMQSSIIVGRLRGKRANCHISNLSCTVNLCGRRFDNIQVLSFHMAYSHTDLSSTGTNASFCFVCGHQFLLPQGKVAHLLSKHRDLFQQHNQQCLDQQQIMYAPNSPQVARLGENGMEEEMMINGNEMGLPH